MYAVIRAGGKQYRVSPGDVVRLETQPGVSEGKIEFNDVLAVSPDAGQIARPQSGAMVTGEVLGEGRGRKVLVFHYKRKKQYKKLAGHRQPFTSVRITEIAFDDQKFTAPELPRKQTKPVRERAQKKTPETQDASPTTAAGAARKQPKKGKATVRKKSPAGKRTAPKKK